MGYSPQGRKELDSTEATNTHKLTNPPRTNLTMSSDRGLATPVGIGVSGTSGVNIVIKSPCLFAFLLAWVRPPEGVFSKEHALHIVY